MGEAVTRLWTSHLHENDVPWVTTSVPGMETRLIHYREDEQMIATQLRAAPLVVSPPHVHLGPAHAMTMSGRWGHDKNYEYVRGTYVFEPVGVKHRFFAGPDTVEAFFVAFGESYWVDPETGEQGPPLGAAAQAASYFQLCEAQGLPRPNVLRV